MPTKNSTPSDTDSAVAAPPGPAIPACQACGHAANDGDAFCPGCGHRQMATNGGNCRLPAGAAPSTSAATDPATGEIVGGRHIAQSECEKAGGPAATSSPMPSPSPSCRCGAGLLGGAKFCHSCGLRVGSPSPAFRLVCKGRVNGQRVVELGEGVMTIGSALDCDVVVPGDVYASRRHARITRVDGGFQLEDLGSSNGTFLRIRRPIALEVGDEIMVGTTAIQLEAVPA